MYRSRLKTHNFMDIPYLLLLEILLELAVTGYLPAYPGQTGTG